MQTNQEQINQVQASIRKNLAEGYGIDPERILFLNPDKPADPWLPADALVAIARASGQVESVSESFAQYVADLQQVVHTASVIDVQGRTFQASGVAMINEHPSVAASVLAASRAVKSVLRAAGFDPFRNGTVVSVEVLRSAGRPVATPEESRLNDLRQIHALAADKGLIVGRDYYAYRQFLARYFDGATSAAAFDGPTRTLLINYLRNLEPIPDEFHEMEVAA